MNVLLAVALALPLLGAVAIPLSTKWGRPAAVVTSTLAAIAWAVLVSAGQPPSLGRVVATPLVAAAMAGAAWLVAARLPRSTLGGSVALCGVTLFAAAASTGNRDLPDRPLAVGALLIVGALAVALRAGGAPIVTVLVTAASGAALATAWSFDDVGIGAAVALGGALVVLLVAVRHAPAVLVAPLVALVVVRTADIARAATPMESSDILGRVAAGAAVLVAIALAVEVRSARPRHRSSPGVAVIVAGITLATQDVVDLRTAGVLLLAGGIVAAASRRGLALVAALPGLVATVAAFGRADDPVHAVAGAAVAGLLTIAVVTGRPEPGTAWTSLVRTDWPAMTAAAIFAVVPLWGWTGADLEGYGAAVAAAGAAGTLVLVATMAATVVARSASAVRPPASSVDDPPTDQPRRVGRLKRRLPVATHASTDPLVEEAALEEGLDHSQEGEFEVASDVTPVGETDGQAEHPVAGPPGTVPRRPPRSRVGGRGRLRARPGRSAR